MDSQFTARRRSTPSHRPPLPRGRLRFRTNTADCNSSDSNTSGTGYLDRSTSTTRRASITLPEHSDAQGNNPPRGWRYSREKQHIINYLKDPLSDISTNWDCFQTNRMSPAWVQNYSNVIPLQTSKSTTTRWWNLLNWGGRDYDGKEKRLNATELLSHQVSAPSAMSHFGTDMLQRRCWKKM